MRSIWRSGAPVLLAAALLAGCSLQGAGGATSAPPDSGVAEHWSVLEGEARLPAVGTRWTSGPMEELTPSPDYGELVPYAGAGYYLVYPDGEGGTVQSPSLSSLFGLMTVDGCAVLDPVCTGIYASSRYLRLLLSGRPGDEPHPPGVGADQDRSGGGEPPKRPAHRPGRPGRQLGHPLPVLGRGGQPSGRLCRRRHRALPAEHGDRRGAEKLDLGPAGGGGPGGLPLVCQRYGDHRPVGGGRLLPGDLGRGVHGPPAGPGAQTGWQAEAAEDGTVTVSKGDTSYTFQSPLPAVQYPYVQEDRVFFYDYSSSAAAVTTLEGKTVLTAPLGQLNTLFGEDVRYLAACPQDGADWTLYSWDGEALITLPGGTGSWCFLQGPLVEVLGQEGAAYYRPDTGECVFRAWFDLEERPGLAQSEVQPEQLP